MTALLLLAACGRSRPVVLDFEATVHDQVVACGATLQHEAGPLQVQDLRLFAHDLKGVDAEGQEHPVVLTPSRWQSAQGTVLLDFEDGCHNGTQGTNRQIIGTTQAKAPFTALRFTLGPSPQENHADPLKAEGPLATLSMHWTWASGYKFLRLDWTQQGQAHRQHIGSTGCPDPLGEPQICARPNRAQVEVDLSPEQPIRLNLSPLLDPSSDCMGAPEDTGCQALFRALNLDPQQGTSSGPTALVQGPA